MRRHLRRVLRYGTLGVLLTALLAGILTVTTSPASAHDKLNPYPTNCAGSQVGHWHNSELTVDLTAFVFYSSGNGGTNCVWVQKQSHRDHAESMRLEVQRCASNIPGNPCNATLTVADEGLFQYYAGPATVSQADNRCIRFRVRLHGGWTGWTEPIHCG
ncbi:hypothetical protein ACI2K4_04540 [Micromonospora sp. NPDC050397]|uniref:hypothetical protein n=1 Tax=Micromonospora sp. NPDC050397 TaxID=3364279 RepID=UPI00384BB325